MKYPNLSDAEHARRKTMAKAVIARGGNLKDFAKILGVSSPGALKWLVTYAPDLHKQMKGDRFVKTTPHHTVLVRLLLLKSVEGVRGGRPKLLKALNRSQTWCVAFLRQWAPDGLDAAIADLMPDNDTDKCALNAKLQNAVTRPVLEDAHG